MLKEAKNKVKEIWENHSDAISYAVVIGSTGYACYQLGKLDGCLIMLKAALEAKAEENQR